MTRAELKQRIDAAIDTRAGEIIGLGEQIRKNPELGFKEVKTARLVEETFGKLGLAPRGGLAMTGVRADVAGRAGDGPTFALLGELGSWLQLLVAFDVIMLVVGAGTYGFLLEE